MAYLIKPLRSEELEPAIELAIARFAEIQQASHEAASLRQALDDRKLKSGAGMLPQRTGGGGVATPVSCHVSVSAVATTSGSRPYAVLTIAWPVLPGWVRPCLGEQHRVHPSSPSRQSHRRTLACTCGTVGRTSPPRGEDRGGGVDRPRSARLPERRGARPCSVPTPRRSWWLLALALGLVILLVGFERPLIGPVLHAIVFCLGLGALGAALRQVVRPLAA
jgi:hypothetical protein